MFATYTEVAAAVVAGTIDAYASVAMAHHGYLARNSAVALATIEVPSDEKAAEQGAFAFAKSKTGLRGEIDDVLSSFLGSASHRALVAQFGVSPDAPG
jgi:polar amino acid transport system substrate-binding protein